WLTGPERNLRTRRPGTTLVASPPRHRAHGRFLPDRTGTAFAASAPPAPAPHADREGLRASPATVPDKEKELHPCIAESSLPRCCCRRCARRRCRRRRKAQAVRACPPGTRRPSTPPATGWSTRTACTRPTS